MRDGLRRAIEERLSAHAGREVRVTGEAPLGGGCINDARRLDTTAGPFFLKSNADPLPRLFEHEAAGLEALHDAGQLTVPRPVAHHNGGDGVPPYLLTTWIATGRRAPDFSEQFGRRFARLHRNATGERFGFHDDNYLGSTAQPNPWTDDWVAFWRDHRLGFQLGLARRNGHTGELETLGTRLLDRLGDYLAEPDEPPALLHGDLWGGNYLVDETGHAAIIDPAAYYGRREADLAMTRLFGGFDGAFYAAYEEEWPLAEGAPDRIEIYTLYHLLNHLNLFGGSYLGGCLRILKRYA